MFVTKKDLTARYRIALLTYTYSIIKLKAAGSHPGSGSDRTIASVRQVTALAMLYIGQLVTCGIDYSFTR